MREAVKSQWKKVSTSDWFSFIILTSDKNPKNAKKNSIEKGSATKFRPSFLLPLAQTIADDAQLLLNATKPV